VCQCLYMCLQSLLLLRNNLQPLIVHSSYLCFLDSVTDAYRLLSLLLMLLLLCACVCVCILMCVLVCVQHWTWSSDIPTNARNISPKNSEKPSRTYGRSRPPQRTKVYCVNISSYISLCVCVCVSVG
jgi:hypothetical protein